MKKIISLFQRNYDGDRLVRDEFTPGAEWVVAGEGVATAKFDGTSCLYLHQVLYKRYELKRGKTPPKDFLPAQDPDPITGDQPGWIPTVLEKPEDKWHWEGFTVAQIFLRKQTWTYELVGPKVQGNPYGYDHHTLIPHGDCVMTNAPVEFDDLRDYLADIYLEGLVWWRDPTDLDCDKVKIKRKDFGLLWPVKPEVRA